MRRRLSEESRPRDANGPMTSREILELDNIPASAPVPGSFRPNGSRIVVSSDHPAFDPRNHFLPMEDVAGGWQLETDFPVANGIAVQTTTIVEPGSLRSSDESIQGQGFRPEWQPHIYHPKAALYIDERPTLRRKSGVKVRPDYVYLPDDRLIFVPEGYPWSCVGRVVVQADGSARSTGTATLVGSRVVLTSSHMIPWDGRRFTLKFVPAYINGLSFGTGGLEAYATVVLGYRNGRQGHDLAVCRLDVPLGHRLGYFGYTIYDDDWEDDPRWTLVGYPGVWRGIDIGGEFPTRQFGISIEDDDADGDALELEHYGDTSPGNSGGPLFGFWPSGPYVIGVQSGGERAVSSNNLAAGGRAMTDLVTWARSNWP
jgi:V8-like Glu-specific endopeptidase